MTDTPLPPRWMRPALFGSAALFMGSAALFYWASGRAAVAPLTQAISVEVGPRSCDPMDLTVAAGKVSFVIHNRSDRPIEWEILDGPMVVEERENILPGLQAQLSARLKPGEYQITCGLLSNPRGSLRVLPSAQSEAERQAPLTTAFIGPLSEYRVYTLGRAGALVKATTALEAAIVAGDRSAAQEAWRAARQSYKQLEPLAARIAALEDRIDPLPDYLAQREADPGYLGFHRLEDGLWQNQDLAPLVAVAQGLKADVTALQLALKAQKLQPQDLAALAQRQAEQIAQGQALTPQSLASGSDLADLSAALDGIAKPLQLLLPLLREADEDHAKALEAALAAAVPPQEDSAAARRPFADALIQLATIAAGVNPRLGLE